MSHGGKESSCPPVPLQILTLKGSTMLRSHSHHVGEGEAALPCLIEQALETLNFGSTSGFKAAMRHVQLPVPEQVLMLQGVA